MDKKVASLAIFGGKPAFKAPLHVGRPNLGSKQKFQARMNKIWQSGWLTNRGLYVQDLEKRIARYLGVKHCIAMCNGTVALEIAIRALGMTGEVIVPSFTFVATAHALQWQEITPVFCDVVKGGYTIDPAKVEQAITPRTSGIIGVHVWGIPCDISALTSIARRHGLKLLFDAAHAIGCTYRGRKIGGFGHAEVLSFHATKILNSFEGGAVVTNDTKLADKIRLMQNFGFSGYDRVIYIGTNGKMNEASAAMGLTNFESLDSFIRKNKNNYEVYRRKLEGIPGVRLVPYSPKEKNNYQYVVIEVDERVAGISRDRLAEILHAENILARRYFYPGCHAMEPYRSYYPHAVLRLPRTLALTNRVLSLPTGILIKPSAIRMVAKIIRSIVRDSPAIESRLQKIKVRKFPVKRAGW